MGLFKCMKSGRRSRDSSPSRKSGSKTQSPSPSRSAYGSARASPGPAAGASPAAKSSASYSGAAVASGYAFPSTSSAAALLLAPGPPASGGRGAKHARDVQLLDYRGTGLLELPGEVFTSERTLLHLYADNNRLVELPRVRTALRTHTCSLPVPLVLYWERVKTHEWKTRKT